MLMKLCDKCGRQIPLSDICSCQTSRHKLYNKSQRNKDLDAFYQSKTWKRLVKVVKNRANGLDEYALAHGELTPGNTVHHIQPVQDRPDLKTSLDNLIFLSAKSHNHIHSEYDKGSTVKRLLQEELTSIVKKSLEGVCQIV